MQHDPTAVTAQGFDANWGTNCLGPYFWTKLLEPALLASSSTKARVVNTSSMVYKYSVPTLSGIDEDTLVAGSKRDEAIKKLGSQAT